MDVKMGNGAVSLGDALFPLFPCLWVSLCNSKCPQEGALATTFPQGAPRAAIYTWHAETAPPRERPLHCKHRLASWSEACLLWQIPLLTPFLKFVVAHIMCLCPHVLGPLIVCPHTTHRPTRCPDRRFQAIQLGSLVCAVSLFFVVSSLE